MCYHHEQQQWRRQDDDNPSRSRARIAAAVRSATVVENLRSRLAETEARLARARAREAELSRQLNDMKRFVSVMEILEAYLNRRFREQQQIIDVQMRDHGRMSSLDTPLATLGTSEMK